MSKVYHAMKVFFKLVVNTFFREIQVIGLENIPLGVPMILCGNHSNQFVDGMMIVNVVPREVSFIMAAKSVRRRVIGDIAKLINVVPVERPQDLAKNGKGKIINIKNSILKGEGTLFTKECKVGDTILLQSNKKEFQIKAIINDLELKIFSLEEENPSYDDINSSYKIIPKVDQSDMFENVFTSLKANRCIGIFPEGGSHDRSDFLELKAGIAIMALGAMSKYGIRVHIVPIGLNYYNPSSFRSKVLIDIGQAYAIPDQLVELYQKSKREAITLLLSEIENRMKACRITAPTYTELSSIFLIRDIYKPDKNFKLTAEKEQALNRKFSEGYNKLKDHPEVVSVMQVIKKYYTDLKILNIKDSEVLTYSTTFFNDLLEIFVCIFWIFFSGSFALPGVVLGGPFALFLQYLAEKERKKALAGSKVKISANDVVASYKIVCAFIVFPIQSMIFTVGFYFLIAAFVTSDIKYQALITLGFFLIWPIYAYMMFVSMDNVIKNFRTLKAKVSGLLFGTKYNSLKKIRNEIQFKIREFVDKHGPEVFEDFENKRVISKRELNNRRGSWMLEEVFSILEEKGI